MRHSLRPRWMLVALAVVAWTGVADAVSDGTVELGGGFTWTRLTLDPEVSGAEVDDVDTRGYYVTVRFVARHGGYIGSSFTYADADDSTLHDRLYYLDLVVGKEFFRRDLRGTRAIVRPLVYVGFAGVNYRRKRLDRELISDKQLSLSLGAGLVAGRGRHAFYGDVNHVIVQGYAAVEGAGQLRLAPTSLRLGYLFSFPQR